MAIVTNFDELKRLRDEAARLGYGSRAWIEFASTMFESLPAIYETAKRMNQKLVELEANKGIHWMTPEQAPMVLEYELDDTGAADGCVVKLDVLHPAHDSGPYLRQAVYDVTIPGFACASTGVHLAHVKAWTFDKEESVEEVPA